MKNSGNLLVQKDSAYHRSLQQELLRRAMRQNPAAFRHELRISHARETFPALEQPWQAADFRALDPAWQVLAGCRATAPYRRAYIERPRGHSKTSDLAMQIAWILSCSQRPLVGLAAAADLEQARLLSDAVQRLVHWNPLWCAKLVFRQHAIRNPKNHCELRFLASDVASSWGVLPDFIICDELCHWEHAAMWESLFSSAAKRAQCVLTVLTNAGLGRGWQWEVREAARQSPQWYFSSLTGPQAPWIGADLLAEQRRLLPPSVYERLWNNVWQVGGGEFVTLAEAEACRNEHLSEQSCGQNDIEYVAAIDYAEKRDNTVGVVMHRVGSQYIVDRMDVCCPTPESPVPVAWVERWIVEMARNFPGIRFAVDPYQLVGVIQRWEQIYPLRRIAFRGGETNHRMALLLRQLIVQRQLSWYPGCGAVSVAWGRDDLETELAALLWREHVSGRGRFDHRQDDRHHDNRAFALAAACLELQQPVTPASTWMDIAEMW